MKIQAQFFGALRARLGVAEQTLDLPEGCLASDAARVACETLGPEWLRALRLAVNEELVPADTRLKEGDQVALLPPVSGGWVTC